MATCPMRSDPKDTIHPRLYQCLACGWLTTAPNYPPRECRDMTPEQREQFTGYKEPVATK